MSSATLPIEARPTPEQVLLTDQIGNEVYASHYAERKLSRFVIGTESVLLLGAMGLIFSLAHRPIANRYIRIDEMGRAQAIASATASMILPTSSLSNTPATSPIVLWTSG